MLAQFGVFEAGLRLKGNSEAAPGFQRLFMTDPYIGYRLRPGARTHFKTSEFETDIQIDGAGVRDDEIPPKAPGERRIVVLGDSLVMAIQVPTAQTFCRRLEERLNADPAAPYHYRVINAGVQGYGPVEELLFDEHVARALDPDVVLVAVFVGNDAMEAADSASKLGAASMAAAAPPPADTRAWIRRVVRRSMVLQIFRMRLLEVGWRLGRREPIDRALTMYLPQTPPDMQRGLAVTRECMTRIRALAAQQRARAGIVLLPARFQVADDDFARLKEMVAQDGATLVRDAATHRFAAALAGAGLPLLDALPALRDSPHRARIFFQDTVHLTPIGHDVLAAALERFLFDSRLLDPPRRAPVAAASRP